MNTHLSRIRRLLLLVAVCFASGNAYAQQQELFDEYRRLAGEKALLFSGKMAQEYLPHQYDNHPYWKESGEFQKGAVCLDGNLYTDVMLRYDTYTKQLTVGTQERRTVLLVEMHRVDYFVLDGIRFNRKGRNDFAAVLYESPRMQLLQLSTAQLGPNVEKNRVSYRHFNRKTRCMLVKEGMEHPVSSQSSVLKLFPKQKKALKAFAEKHKLNFRKDRIRALRALVKRADTLTANTELP